MFRTTQSRIGAGAPYLAASLRTHSIPRSQTLGNLPLRYPALTSLNSIHNYARHLYSTKAEPTILRRDGLPPAEVNNGFFFPLILHPKADKAPKQYPKPGSVGIIGGGITGMMAAFWIKLLHPEVPVTIIEKSDRMGGWIKTTRTEEYDGHVIPMESGPRTFKIDGNSSPTMMDLLRRLKLEKEIMGVPVDAPASINRYLWLNSTIVRLPGPGEVWGSIKTVLKHRIFARAAWAYLREPNQPPRDPTIRDETLGDFAARRVGREIVDYLASAIIHGIYAGDINKLSAKSIVGKLWATEAMYGSIMGSSDDKKNRPSITTAEMLNTLELLAKDSHPNTEIRKALSHHKIIAFRDGAETLVKALEWDLLNKGVHIVKRRSIKALRQNIKTGNITCEAEDGKVSHFTHVISTLSGPQLDKLLPESIPQLKSIESVTVQVVNLYFKTPNLNPPGFGYLIPQTTPAEENPENALGVVFDSDAKNCLVPLNEYSQDPVQKIPGTLVTVMMGGHYWSGRTQYPTDEEAVLLARTTLARHLGIVEEPVLSKVSLQKDCIPQYTVGHSERLGEAHEQLADMFTCRLSVAGSSYNGVSIPDLMMAGREVAAGVLGYRARTYEEGFTGLEGFSEATPNKYWSLNEIHQAIQVSVDVRKSLENVPRPEPAKPFYPRHVRRRR